MAFDCFLEISTIPGECTVKNYEEWMEIDSYDHGVSQSGAGTVSSAGSLTGGRCDHDLFTIVHNLDKASPKLALACCKGEHIETVKLHICRAGGDRQKFMEYILTDVIVSSVRPAGSSKSDSTVPSESVCFKYGKIEWMYTILNQATGQPEGDIVTSWDLHTSVGE